MGNEQEGMGMGNEHRPENVKYLIREWVEFCLEAGHDMDILVYGVERITKKPRVCLAYGFSRMVIWRQETRKPEKHSETPLGTPIGTL